MAITAYDQFAEKPIENLTLVTISPVLNHLEPLIVVLPAAVDNGSAQLSSLSTVARRGRFRVGEQGVNDRGGVRVQPVLLRRVPA